MNNSTADLMIKEMEDHILSRIEFLVLMNRNADAHAVSLEWIVDGLNPTTDPNYEFCVDTFYKKSRNNTYKKFEDLDF